MMNTDPMSDEIDVVYPNADLLLSLPESEWGDAKPATVTDRVTRGEFMRRMAGIGACANVGECRGIRVVALMAENTLERWLATRPVT